MDEKGLTRFRLPRQPIVMDDLVCGRVEVDRSKPINPLGDLEPDMTIRRPGRLVDFPFRQRGG